METVKKAYVELFGLKVITEDTVPQDTMIVIGEIPKEKLLEFKSVADVMMYLLEKERVYIFDAMNKIGRGFHNGKKRDIGDR